MQLFLKDNLTIWAVFFYFCFWTAFIIRVEIYRRYIGLGCTRSALARKLIWKGILVYRRYIGACCTRSAVDLLKVFTTIRNTSITEVNLECKSWMSAIIGLYIVSQLKILVSGEVKGFIRPFEFWFLWWMLCSPWNSRFRTGIISYLKQTLTAPQQRVGQRGTCSRSCVSTFLKNSNQRIYL